MSLPKLPELPKLGALPSLPKLPSVADLPDLPALNVDRAPPPDPLAGVQYTDNLEADAAAELTELQKAFRERAAAEQERMRLATDSEYWFAVCFQTREQKDAFLHALELYQHGDKYLDGARVAKRLGIALPPAEVPYNISAKVDRKLRDLT